MSAISGAGMGLKGVLGWSLPQVAGGTTSASSSSISGSIHGSLGAVAGAKGKGHGLGAVSMKRIEKAVTAALQSAKPTDDPNAVVQKAITGALKGGGTDTDGDSDAGGVDSDGAHQTFVQTLTAYGVTPQQFHDDLLKAMQQAQGTGAGGSVSSFPMGMVLDTSA